MTNKEFFDDEVKERFSLISSRLYNLKYSMKLLIDYLENDTETTLDVKCLSLVLKDYFDKTKEEYNRLEEDLGVIL